MAQREVDQEVGMGLRSRAPTDKITPSIAISEKASSSYPFPRSHTDEQDEDRVDRELKQAMKDMKKWYDHDFPEKNTAKIAREKGFFQWLKRRPAPVRFAIYISPLAIPLVIPMALLSSIFKTPNTVIGTNPNPIHAGGLLIWIEIVVVALWVAMTLAWSWIWLFNRGCEWIKSKMKSHQLLLEALQDISRNLMHLPITLVLWTIISFATTPVMCVLPEDKQCDTSSSYWIYTVNRVFEAGIVVSFLVWVERVLIGMSFISYYGKQYDHKNAVLQWDIGQIKKLFYMTLHKRPKHGFLSHENAKACQDCEARHVKGADFCLSSWADHDWNDVFKSAISHQDSAEALGIYLWYAIKFDVIDLEEYQSYQSKSPEDAEKYIKEALYTQQLQDWVLEGQEHFPQHKRGWITEMREEVRAEDVGDLDTKAFTDILNGDNDEDIEFDEMRTSVRRIGRRKEALTKTLKNVREAMESLDRPLSVIVLIAIAFVYAAFFVPNFNTYATAIFTAFTGLGFALSGTVTEFLGSCIFLFVKHPYYVGDRIMINKVQLEVDRISLMSTKFSRVDNGTFVQLPHGLLNTFWIENLTRSKHLKEYFTIAVSPDTEVDTIKKIRDDMKRFVKMNNRDFMDDSAKIEVSSVSDLTQVRLDVEVEHKFKYLDDDVHADRQIRFKMAFLHFLRHRKVLPPNVDPVPLGDPTRPMHNITSNVDDVLRYKNDFDKDQERLDMRRRRQADEYRKEDTTPRPSRSSTPLLAPGF